MRPSRLRLRRRLLLFSAPVVIVALMIALKLISAVVAGHSAVSSFAARDADALRGDVAVMGLLNVVEPAKAPFAAGTLAVLDDRLAEADAHFSESLGRTAPDRSCPVLINLELVRERQGDIDAWENRPGAARDRYLSALDLVENAPDGCFAGNTDPDPERRAVRHDAAARLQAKLAGLAAPPPPPPAPPLAPPPPPQAPAPAPVVPDADTPRDALRLDPGSGDPLDKLEQVLRDAAG
ncbi:hypothetical protein H7I77_20715 [Mycolicibacterium novocastrense]|uniref:Histidine kinase n=1 Tax=Mycolicibacterium novocastrense TaxID=59813 RepID=A0AAW5SQ99_MYCNV|nr:hypothetical protein [Mycolicibacterium novocastrense]MCV7025745.1 hypothetical protein [Mycolicibacterium novocastrense]GAT07847.1 uncharacterized protein RMCN_0980 [Mycolicibacterium novocastrense]